MRIPELLVPASSLEVLQVAVIFGAEKVEASLRISSRVLPTIGTQIFGLPSPMVMFLTFTVFIVFSFPEKRFTF